jgi:hypothetical protein
MRAEPYRQRRAAARGHAGPAAPSGVAGPATQFRYRRAKLRAGFLSQAKQVGEGVPPDHGAWYWV